MVFRESSSSKMQNGETWRVFYCGEYGVLLFSSPGVLRLGRGDNNLFFTFPFSPLQRAESSA